MKKNLFLTAVIAVTALTFFGCQDPIKDLTITQTPGSAPEVAAESIVAKALSLADGSSGILVKWDRSENGSSYSVWRREIDADNNPVDATAVELSGSQGSTSVKKIPYYWDDEVKVDTKYQYGIVSATYKNNASGDVKQISDIVWQTVEDDAYAKALAKQTEIKIIKNPATAPKITVKPYTNYIEASTNKPYWDTTTNTWNGGGYGNSTTVVSAALPDGYLVTITGLTYGYTYDFGIQTSYNSTSVGHPVGYNTNDWSFKSDGNNNGIISWTDSFSPNTTDLDILRGRYFTAELEGYKYEDITFSGTVEINWLGLSFNTGVNGTTGHYNYKQPTTVEVKAFRPAVQYSTPTNLIKLEITAGSTADKIAGKPTSDLVPFAGTDQLFSF